ncbi:MAG TPA: hypothetical protein VFN97_15720 [Actinospica sp.]|nr:hypothetical protein [Actinospica sp.]
MSDETERLTEHLTGPMTEPMTEALTQRIENPAASPDHVETYVRFGPGVPGRLAPAPDRATAIWRGDVRPAGAGAATETVRRRSRRWILPLTVLILAVAVVIYLLWGRGATPVAVESIGVKAATPTVSCGQTERLTAVITTNGGSGTLTYQWARSDGTHSDVLTQTMNKGEAQATVALLWNFDGPGTYDATATLHILSPGSTSGSARFRYVCGTS